MFSIVVHAGIAFALLRAPTEKTPEKVISIDVEQSDKKPLPPPRSQPRSTPVRLASLSRGIVSPRPVRSVVAERPAPAPPAAAPFDSGVHLGNGGDGIALPEARPEKPAARPAPVARPKTAPVKILDGQPCEEPLAKPTVLDRATAIQYPAEARAAGIVGRLVLKVIVGADGSADEVEVVQGVDAALDAAAIGAVKTWRFQPASKCGKSVAGGVYLLARRFELGD